MAGTHEPVAVVGIGAMGHGMATSALRGGIPTIVWNRDPDVTRDLAKLGAEVAETAADAARRAAIVVTMVTDTDAVVSIAQDQGMLAALPRGAIWVQMSTIGVAASTASPPWCRPSARTWSSRRAGVRKQGSSGAGPAHHLRVWAR
jgi:3-hydroxyisobutyrate dehydrogenase